MPTQDEIRELAHRLWEEDGRPKGKDLEHWTKATAMLESGQSAGNAPAKTRAKAPAAKSPAARRTAVRTPKT
jgi:hypothetical protein